jgi:alpha-tubulin suppressor-like RCC1 family protein
MNTTQLYSCPNILFRSLYSTHVNQAENSKPKCSKQAFAQIKSRACTHPAGVSATAVSTGAYYTCAIVTGGGLRCWGYNGNGQLGIGSTSSQYSPVAVGLGSGMSVQHALLPRARSKTRAVFFVAFALRCPLCHNIMA